MEPKPAPLGSDVAAASLPRGGPPQVRRPGIPAGRPQVLPAALTAAPDPISLLRALKRQLPLALGLSVLGAGLVGVLASILVPPAKYTARAVVQVASQRPMVLFNLVDNQNRYGEDAKQFQSNQTALIQSYLVLNKALESLDWPKLKTFPKDSSALDYLRNNLQLGFPNGAELLEITLSGDHPDELAAIVNAVKDAYKLEVLNYDRRRRMERAEKLRGSYERLFADLKARHEEKRKLAETVGSEDPETIARKQQLADQSLGELERELMRLRSVREDLELKLGVQEKLAATADARGVPLGAAEVDQAVEQIPSVAVLRAQAEQATGRWRQVMGDARSLRNPQNEPYTKSLKADADRLAHELAQERARVRPLVEQQLRKAAADTRDDGLTRLQFEVEAWRGRELALETQIASRSSSMQRLNVNSLEMRAKQREIDHLDGVNSTIQEELAKLEVELLAPERVREIEMATPPAQADQKRRLLAIAGASIGTFLGCLSLVTLLEFRARKLGSAEEIVEGLGLPLVGALPPLPAAARRGAAGTALEQSDWYQILLESIDAARTMLVHQARTDGLRVVLVTSALGGEGKTSLSCHLATSLARAGFRTVLVDADMRRPAVDRVFDVERTPGLAELLRGETTLDEALRPITAAELTVLPAGTCDERALRNLSQGSLAPWLARLRERFDFIVADTAPVLPIADTQIIAPHADGVILATLHGVSRLPKVFAATQRLSALGVRILGAVVTGVRGGLYGQDAQYGYSYAGAARSFDGAGRGPGHE